ncbi:MAG: SCO family protein [Candidatus Competibacteraceae bacterium]|jgi:cytochrome oxidase Cu insertion factor (SCO1/SenC/PrrC family)|nr:SCO family protein [Candidatus Competibacteraceae bacterium]
MLTQILPQDPTQRNKLFLLFIIALFAVPLALAWVLVSSVSPDSTKNHGELLNPAQPVPHLSASQIDGQPLTKADLRGRWNLLYIAGTSCDERCKTGLYDIRQVRVALGKNTPRSQTLFLLQEAPDAELLDWLQREHVGLTVAVADSQTLNFFTQAFAGDAVFGDWIYLIDPLGNLFMRYSTTVDPKGILDDLRHLLKISKIG